jgi:hypothetical protein
MLYPLIRLEALLLIAFTTLTFASSNDITTSTSTDGVTLECLFLPLCGKGHSTAKPFHVPVDRCVNIPNQGLKIQKPATCANGTRALWARWPEKRCSNGTLDPEYGLVPIWFKDIGTFLDVKKFESMAFWCDGFNGTFPKHDEKKPDNADKSKKGSVSESACIAQKAPFWKHPKADTCVNLHTDNVKFSHMATCANGTRSTVALYKDAGCLGAPSEIKDVNEEETKRCMNVKGTSSFAYYCTGEGIGNSIGGGHDQNSGIQNGEIQNGEIQNGGTQKDGSQTSGNGGLLHFLFVLTCIVIIFSLMLLLAIFAWIRKYGSSVGSVFELISVSYSPIVTQGNVNIDFLLLEPRKA